MCPDEAKWLLAVVREHGNPDLTRLVMQAFWFDPGLVLLAPIEGKSRLGYPVDVFLPGEPIPAGTSRSPFGRVFLPVYPDARPGRGRPRRVVASEVQVRKMLTRAVRRVWSYVREAVAGLPREAPAGRVVVDGKSSHWVETPERVDVGGFPLVLGCWLLRQRGDSYSKIAGRLRAVAPSGDVADLRTRAARYVRAAELVIFRASAT